MATMKAVILDAPGPPDHTWLGLAQGLTFPRVLGTEARAPWPAARAASFRFVSRICPGLASNPTVKEP
jgi:hypothetical protein